jgi:hypothetical protein
MTAPVDPKAKAHVTEQLLKMILTLSLVEMAEVQATWLECPDLDQTVYQEYAAKKESYEAALLDYVAARRDLIRWGVVT